MGQDCSSAAANRRNRIDDVPLDLFALACQCIVDDLGRNHTLFDVDDPFPPLLLESDRDLPLLLRLVLYGRGGRVLRLLAALLLLVIAPMTSRRSLEMRRQFCAVSVLKR